ncbi:MAG TPA: Rieske 2Fe-2S domain-containing protein [Candidatus Limnocylindrales bacterium]
MPAGRDRRPAPADGVSIEERLALAILPLRLFLGGTFVYAGLDKIIDPTFLRSVGPGSIASQLEAFTRESPIGLIVHLFGQPFPVAVGWMIALAEIAIGLGALLGLAFRLSASGGAALSFLFWLTASWATRPYYYGPDLPYAFAWLTLAFVGSGGRFTLDGYFASPDDGWADTFSAAGTDRRLFLQAGVLGAGAIALAAIGGTLGAAVFRPATRTASVGQGGLGDGTSSPVPGSSPSPSPSSAPTVGQSAAPPPSGTVIARISAITTRRPATFVDPQTGDSGVVIKLASGSFVAYDATCTHAGCTVQFDPSSSLLICPCHGATFDPSHDAQVLGGPTGTPLTRLPIKVDPATGKVYLQG